MLNPNTLEQDPESDEKIGSKRVRSVLWCLRALTTPRISLTPSHVAATATPALAAPPTAAEVSKAAAAAAVAASLSCSNIFPSVFPAAEGSDNVLLPQQQQQQQQEDSSIGGLAISAAAVATRALNCNGSPKEAFIGVPTQPLPVATKLVGALQAPTDSLEVLEPLQSWGFSTVGCGVAAKISRLCQEEQQLQQKEQRQGQGQDQQQPQRQQQDLQVLSGLWYMRGPSELQNMAKDTLSTTPAVDRGSTVAAAVVSAFPVSLPPATVHMEGCTMNSKAKNVIN